MNPDTTGPMLIALQEAETSLREGNCGFGAVVVRGPEVLARAHDTEKTDSDPTAHAEIAAIRGCARRIGPDLRGCTLVSTHEPCPMCATAAVWAGLDRVVYGFSIQDAISQGRRRIALPCREIFERAGRSIDIQDGVLRDRCAILYDEEVRDQVRRLRRADESEMAQMAQALTEKRLRWFDEQPEVLADAERDPLMHGYRLLLRKLGIPAEEAPIVARDAGSLSFASRNFCPTLEACRMLGLDTRWVCRRLTEAPTQAFLRRIDPRLRFSRDYENLRPSGPACLETISLEA